MSTKSSGLTVNSEDLLDDSESDRLSAEDDDVFVDGATSNTARDNVVIPSVEILNGLELTENQVLCFTLTMMHDGTVQMVI